MKIVATHCASCGAPLEIPLRAKRVTCLYCETVLDVVSTGSVLTTRVVEELLARVTGTELSLEWLKIQQRIQSLDHEWMRYRNEVMIRHKGGIPTQGASYVLYLFALVTSVVAFATLKDGGAIGFLLAVGFVAFGWSNSSSASDFEARRANYRTRREILVEQLRQAEIDHALDSTPDADVDGPELVG